MSEALKSKIEELSLLAVMTSEDDRPGLEMLAGMLAELHTLSASGALDESGLRVGKSAHSLASKGADLSLESVNEFLSAAGQVLEGRTSVVLPGEEARSGQTDSAEAATDLSQIDKRFLSEFIETHRLGLEDLEGHLLALTSGDAGDTMKTIKGYLHSLKGDAGSIGLVGMSEVCHTLEDLIQERPAEDLLSALLLFQEWALNCLQAFSEGASEKVSATRFLGVLSGLGSLPGIARRSESQDAIDEQIPEVQETSGDLAGEGDSDRYQLSGEMDILFEFAAEAEEHLGNVEAVALGADANLAKESIDTIFRGVHSLKGGSAYFTLKEMTGCSHILENLLSEVRDGKRELNAELMGLVLEYIDLQKDVLRRAKQAAQGSASLVWTKESKDYLDRLHRFEAGEVSSVPRQPQPSAHPVHTPNEVAAEPASSRAAAIREIAGAPASEGARAGSASVEVRNFVKVDTARLDHLIDSVGEMAIYSSMLVRLVREHLSNNPRANDVAQRVEKFSRDLQDVGMSMRLVPIKGLFQKMSRLVWDTSKKLGKDIEFVMEGEDTELDRNLIDKLSDPLMHMVRNSMDHGVEPPEERLTAGKPSRGRVKLSAYHSGGSIHIRIQDDGRGLSPQKLVSKAVEKGVIPPERSLSDQEAFQLIFAAGFSTAAQVTDISGRGVGMDVVRRNVESLRGRIHIDSVVGKGSTFTIELPLTLAIIDGIQVRVGHEHFIAPSLSIVEFIKPTANMINRTFEVGETFSFRGKFLPLFRLSELYGIDTEQSRIEQGTVLVVENGAEQVALFVDEVCGQYSTVIKSLGPVLGEARGFAGCAIMPDGEVALILDLRSLIEYARSSCRQGSSPGAAHPTESLSPHDSGRTLIQ